MEDLINSVRLEPDYQILKSKLEEYGFDFTPEETERLYQKFKDRRNLDSFIPADQLMGIVIMDLMSEPRI